MAFYNGVLLSPDGNPSPVACMQRRSQERRNQAYHYDASVGTSLFTLPTKHLSTLPSKPHSKWYTNVAITRYKTSRVHCSLDHDSFCYSIAYKL